MLSVVSNKGTNRICYYIKDMDKGVMFYRYYRYKSKVVVRDSYRGLQNPCKYYQ